MADEILIKVGVDTAYLESEFNEAKKLGNAAIKEIEKNQINFKVGNAAELTATLKAIAREGGAAFAGLENGVDTVVNDTAKLKAFIDQLTNSLKGMRVGSQEFKMLDEIIKASNTQLNTLNSTVVKTGESIKTQMRKAQAEVAELTLKFGATSKEAIQAAKRAAELKDTIEDANDTIASFKGEGAFTATSKAIGAVASGFSAAQGAMALFGAESEDVQKAILKVQGAMALAQGLQGLEDAGRAFSTLGSVIKTQVVAAFTTLRGAIAATGIGALAIGIGLIVANWEELVGWIEETFPAMKKVTEFFRNFQQNASGVLSSVVAGFRTLGDVIAKTFKGDFTGAFNSAKSLGTNMSKAFREGYDKKDNELKNAELAKEVKHHEKKVKIAKDSTKDISNEIVKQQQEMLMRELTEYQKLYDEIEKLRLDSYDKERQRVNDEFFYKIEKAKQLGLSVVELEKEKAAQLAAIDKKQKDDEIKNGELKKQKIRKEFEDARENYENLKKEEKKLDDEAQEERKKKIQELQQFAAVAQQAYNLFSTAIFSADTQKRQEQLEENNRLMNEELKMAGDNEQKKDIIRQKYQLKEREIKRKQAEADKRKAIFDAIIGTSIAVIQAGLITPMAIIAGALGAAQIALIAATPIPKFAKGVVSFDGKGGLVKGEGTGTSDSNLAYLSKGESVIPAAPTSANLGLINELVNGDVDTYINRHYVMPALQTKESQAANNYRNSVIEAENNLIARVSSHTLKSIHREQKNTTEAVKKLASNKDYSW